MVGGWGVPPRKCSVILNGIEPIECHPEDRYYAHEVFGIPNDGVIVVSTGRATFFKGIDSLIKCAKLLIEQGNARLYFLHCGDGPDLAVFKGMVDAYGLGGRFILAGKRTDVRKILPSCHIGIQMSRGEGFSLSLLEYLSAGLATLATDVGGNREAIMNGKTGILFPLDDLDSVVKTIEELARNDRHREELGAAARESVRVKFNIERTNREFIGLLEGILTA
jgi:glycosyltransferase involved in cell wall biosynthesis